MNPTILQAINSEFLLSFSYDGYHRVVEPHAYGTTADGNEVLRAYQVEGGHKSAHFQNWHLFSVAKMVQVECTNRRFNGPRQGYKRGDKAMEYIHAQL